MESASQGSRFLRVNWSLWPGGRLQFREISGHYLEAGNPTSQCCISKSSEISQTRMATLLWSLPTHEEFSIGSGFSKVLVLKVEWLNREAFKCIGGHIEPGEQLLDAGLRELQEETGLCLQAGEFSWKMLALWESVYPPMLSRGIPKRHHVVVYLLLLSPESHQQLQMRFKPDEAEVSAYTWLEPQVLASVAATEDGARHTKKVAGDLPQVIRITELEHGSAKTTTIPTATFLNTAPPEGEDVERVSTGTKFAVRLWLDTLAPQTE